MTDCSMERAYDLGRASGAIRVAIIYLESKNPETRKLTLGILQDAIKALDDNEKERVAAIFAKEA